MERNVWHVFKVIRSNRPEVEINIRFFICTVKTAENVVWSPNSALFRDTGVAESNDDVRIVIGSLKISVCARRKSILAKNPEWLAGCRAALSCNAIAIASFAWYSRRNTLKIGQTLYNTKIHYKKFIYIEGPTVQEQAV